MRLYRFITHDNGSRTDEIGTMSLGDDDIAWDFGAKIVRDLITGAPGNHVGWTLEIVNGERAVATIPFKFDAIGDS